MENTRDYIIDQAYSLFLSRSYEAVSISEISKSIGLTKGALYHHFLNKEELFKAVIDKHMQVIKLYDLEKGLSLREYIRMAVQKAEEIVKAITSTKQPFNPFNYLSLLIDAFRHYPDFAEDKSQLFKYEISRIKVVLDHAVDSREIRNDINTSVMAYNIFSISLGIAAHIFQSNSPEMAIENFKSQMMELYQILKTGK